MHLIIIAIFLTIASISLASSQPELTVGFASRDITPKLSLDKPVWMAGFAYGRRAASIDSKLQSTAVVFAVGGQSVAIVSVDSIGLGHDDCAAIRTAIYKQNIVDAILVASTHSHQTPDVIGLWGKDATSPGWDEDYVQLIIQQSISAVTAAKAAAKPAQTFYKRLDFPLEEQLMHDFRPPIIKDSGVHVLQVKDQQRTLGNLVIWANHPEAFGSLNTAISPDYPAALRQALAEADLGETLFLVGAIGGLLSPGTETPLPDIQGKTKVIPGKERATAVGLHLAKRVQTAIEKHELPPLPISFVRSYAQDLLIPLENLAFKSAIEHKIIRGHTLVNDKIKSRVSLLELGDLLLVGIPGEIFPEIIWGGIPKSRHTDFPDSYREEPSISQLIGHKPFAIIGLADDELGYIIPKSSWDTKQPNFLGEPTLYYGETNSVGPEAAPLIHSAVKDLLSRLPRSEDGGKTDP